MRLAAEFILTLSISLACARDAWAQNAWTQNAWTQDAQYARLRGHVLDENNAPIANAEISVHYESRDLIIFSDPTGAFTLLVPRPGDYLVRVSSPGYFELRDRHVNFT